MAARKKVKKSAGKKVTTRKSAKKKVKSRANAAAARTTRLGARDRKPFRRTSKPKATKKKVSASTEGPLFGGIGSEAVRRATGKGWPEWIAIIDRAGGAKMSHAEIATYLHEKCNVGDWWSQMVTVGYEHAKGRRVKHQTPGGYEISVSKTLDVPLAIAFAAWENATTRAKWLADSIIDISSKTANKYIRFPWTDGKTRVNLNFYPKGESKSQVTVQHGKLPDSAAAEKFKAYWSDQLNRLTKFLGI